ncbi:MAG: tyrosine-type recombinase/integrase [Clostridiales bacterium]|nr:site-specific integrase [Clostridiales bacterium]MDU3240458.1 tyrosine-type recombinase/integrase [Clostridiales bacterium]
MTVAELFDIWINFKKIEVKKTTISTYLRKIDAYILPELAHYQLDELTVTVITGFVSGLMKTLGSKSVIDIKTILQSAFTFAFKQKYVFDKIEIPAPPHIKKDIDTFSQTEQKKLIDYIVSNLDSRNFLVLLGLGCGMRVGELCSLKYKDIKKICTVRHTVQRIKNMETDTPKTILYLGSPKSALSTRPVPINQFLLNTFSKIYNKKYDDCYILTNTKEFTEPRTLEKYFEKLLRDCKVEYKKFHTLRHSFATNALRIGIDLQTLSEIMGITVKVLISTYIHSDLDVKVKSMEKLQMA